MPTDKLVGLLPTMVKGVLSASLGNVNIFSISVYKLKNPVDCPPLIPRTLPSSELIPGTIAQPYRDLLEKIKFSNIKDFIEAEELDEAFWIKDHFEDGKNNQIQAIFYCSGMPPAVILVRLL
jgi:hypothetical protein